MEKQTLFENGLVADLFYNTSETPQKCLVLLGGSEGGKSWGRVKKPIEIMVNQGYTLVSLAYFKAQNLPPSLEEIPLEYFEKTLDWLSNQTGIVSNQYAIMGASKGSEAALLLASRYPQIKTVIAFSPSSVIWQGIPTNRFDIGKAPKSSWSYQGVGIPFLSYPSSIKKIWPLLTLRLRSVHEQALQDKASRDMASIPVENIQGAILLLSGARDQLWPSTSMGELIIDRLSDHGFGHPYKHLIYDTGHTGLLMNKSCWREVFRFLAEYFS